MKIKQWLGYNDDASQYLLRPGELRVLSNLQARRPGMLITRRGLSKIYGQYDNEGIYGIYRRASILGEPSDFLWFQKIRVQRELTIGQIEDMESPFEYKWAIRRVLANQERIIDIQPLAPHGTMIHGMCIAEDRHNRIFLFYGHGVRPRVYIPEEFSNDVYEMGLDAPLSAPQVTPEGSGFFIDGVTVAYGGGSYNSPPDLKVIGGNPDRPAKLKSLIVGGSVAGVDIIDGGSNYSTPPRIDVANEDMGTGFRAVGIVGGNKDIEGFDEFTSGVITGTGPADGETYGTADGVEGQKILYSARSVVKRERVVSQTGDQVTLDNVDDISVGHVITMYPAKESPWSTGATVTVTAIDQGTKTITLSTTWTGTPGTTVYVATFTAASQVSEATASYNSERRRFTATIPLTSGSSAGQDAKATLEFSPTPLGYGLNAESPQESVTVVNKNWQTYYRSLYNQGKTTKDTNLSTYLYGEYWEGSDFDVQSSVENSRYGGIQAGGGSFVRGYSGTIDNRRADVFFPDYRTISVWLCTGVYSTDIGQWRRIDAPVITEYSDPLNPELSTVTGQYIEFELEPSASAKTIQQRKGTIVGSSLLAAEELPDAVKPRVRVYLKESPDSWVTSETDFSLPSEVKEGQTNRLAWWNPSSGVPRPFVGFQGNEEELDEGTAQIVEAGSGWESGSLFAFRIYQANAYQQTTVYNTATKQSSTSSYHDIYDPKDRYAEFQFRATTPDDQTPHGPPAELITPAQVTIPGEGYRAGETGYVTLLKRSIDAAASTATAAETITWTASLIEELTNNDATVPDAKIVSVRILNKGRNYYSQPTISTRGGGNGYGLAVLPVIEDGRIESVQIIDPGTNYTERPYLYTDSRGAALVATMRPAMRGTYRCAYRFVDRSLTILKTVTATIGGDSNTLVLSDATDIEAEMIVEADELPNNAKIVSVNGSEVEINQEITGLAAETEITVVVRDLTKPIAYSDLSPIADIDAGPNENRPHSSEMVWSLPGINPPARADRVELWRTSADQSLVFYRCESYGIPTDSGVEIVGRDTLTDEELFDPDRPHYAAMPVVLPNGAVNAYRFGQPRKDMSVAVAFQDRLWMGVSTSGKDANTLFYSEFDEFESTPDVNELPIQNNQKTSDVLTALVPFGSILLAMQHTHTYAVAYNTDPAVDATIQMMSHRGCLHQRCWDIHENTLYAADESGIYAMSRNGEVQDISLPLRDYFVSESIDFSKRETFFLQADPKTHILRFYTVLTSSPTETPSVALCYDIQAKTWWTETYPNSLTSACTGRPSAARINTILLGAIDGNLYEIEGDADHSNQSITDCVVTDGGTGYMEAPKITVPNCDGAIAQAVVSDGQLVDVVIQAPGYNATWGVLLQTEDGDTIASHDEKYISGVEYAPIVLEVDPPPDGLQASAVAHYSVTPRIPRYVTVAEGESFVRLQPRTIPGFESSKNIAILTEDSEYIDAESVSDPELDGDDICVEHPPVKIGMQCIGDFVPINSFVSRIEGRDIFLEHPDGTPVSILLGDARYNEPGTDETFLELGGTEVLVEFRQPSQTNIPFRMATGSMQLANDANVRGGDGLVDRSVSVVYTPTESDKEIEVLERFNGQEQLRPNVLRRARGGTAGFTHREDSASTVLNVSKRASHLGLATGVATAKFASRATADMTSEDQHLQVEVYGRPTLANSFERVNFWQDRAAYSPPAQFVLHNLTVDGVLEDAQ